jgi:hypothetical protein
MVEAPAVYRSGAGHVGARGRCPVQAELSSADRTSVRKEGSVMLEKIVYSLGALAVLAMAVGAGFKPN